jgi:hypothetical protein
MTYGRRSIKELDAIVEFYSFNSFSGGPELLNHWNSRNCLNGLLLVQPIDITARFQFFQKTHVGKIAWLSLSRLGVFRFQLVEI